LRVGRQGLSDRVYLGSAEGRGIWWNAQARLGGGYEQRGLWKLDRSRKEDVVDGRLEVIMDGGLRRMLVRKASDWAYRRCNFCG